MSETVLRRIGLVLVTAVVPATFLTSGDVETTLFMVGAVVGGLLCFDVALDRRIKSFGPWLLLSLAPVAKAVPSVWLDLRGDEVQWTARYQHLGSLLLGLAVLAAVGLLAVPAGRRNSSRARPYLVPAVAATAALSGATIGFRYERAFGTVAVARLFETATWAVLGALLAVVVLSAAVQPRPSTSLVIVQLSALVGVGLLAYTVAGRNVDRGWWTFVFAAFAWGAVGFDRGALGTRAGRDRLSRAPATIALGAAAVAATVAISSRADRTAWEYGWPPLAVLALALIVVALVERGHYEANIFEARRRSAGLREAGDATAGHRGATEGTAAALEPHVAAAGEAVVEVPAHVDPLSTADTVARLRAAAEARAVSAAAPPVAAPGEAAIGGPTGVADVRPAPARPDLDPHLFDPSTGLLSSVGLQRELRRVFGRPPAQGEVTLLLIVVRNLGRIEATNGRVRSSIVTTELADRLRRSFGLGVAARFARNGYAIVVEHPSPPGPDLPQRAARLLVRLGAPVAEVDAETDLDLVAGMTQSREGEDLAAFVARANEALAGAVRAGAASLIALP